LIVPGTGDNELVPFVTVIEPVTVARAVDRPDSEMGSNEANSITDSLLIFGNIAVNPFFAPFDTVTNCTTFRNHDF
jgi:hypothetical protein